MVDLLSLKSMMERAIKASQQAIQNGDAVRAQEADGVLERLNTLAETEASRRAPQGQALEAPPDDPLLMKFNKTLNPAPAPAMPVQDKAVLQPAQQAVGTPVDSMQGAKNRVDWSIPKLRSMAEAGGQQAGAREVVESLEQGSPAAAEAGLAKLRELIGGLPAGQTVDTAPGHKEFFDLAGRTIEDMRKYGLVTPVEKGRATLPRGTSESNALARRAKELGLGSAGSPSAPAALQASGAKPEDMDLKVGLIDDLYNKANADPDVPPDEKAALNKFIEGAGKEPKLLTLENILMAFFFGAPTVLQKYGADVRNWKSRIDAREALVFKTKLPAASNSSGNDVASKRAEIARITAMSREGREPLKSQKSDLQITLREVMEDQTMRPDDKKMAVEEILKQLKKVDQKMLEVSTEARTRLSGN